MGFKITKDKLDNGLLVGKSFGNYKGGKNKFRLKDDDSEIYYYGVSDDDSDFMPLDWAMPRFGCTIIEYRNEKTKEYEVL